MFGPQCQKILRPYLMRRAEGEYLFSPRKADKQRREELSEERAKRGTPLAYGNICADYILRETGNQP